MKKAKITKREIMDKRMSARLTNRQYVILDTYCKQHHITVSDLMRINVKEIINPKTK
jgi:hypothetical protein